MSIGGALSYNQRHKQYAKEYCETHNCDILTELSNGKFEAGSTTSMNKCGIQKGNVVRQWRVYH